MIQVRPNIPPRYVVRRMRIEGQLKIHIYLMPKERRDKSKFTWSSLLRAAVYKSFEAAMKDARSLNTRGDWQIVPVGYSGDAYWKNKEHVRHDGPMARYHNPRVFYIDTETGKRIEV